MKHIILLIVALLLAGCNGISGDGSNNNNRQTTRYYHVDCGNAETVGSGSCGLTVTGVNILGGGQ